jgi:hypothetical protein
MQICTFANYESQQQVAVCSTSNTDALKMKKEKVTRKLADVSTPIALAE